MNSFEGFPSAGKAEGRFLCALLGEAGSLLKPRESCIMKWQLSAQAGYGEV